MKQSVIAIFLMLVLILLASNLPGQFYTTQASMAGRYDYSMVPPLSAMPSPTPFQPLPAVKTKTYLFVPIVSKAEEILISASEPTVVPTPAPTEPPPAEAEVAQAEPTQAPEEEAAIQYTSEEGRSWADYPGPSIWPDLAIPAPVGILSHPEDQVNVLLLGSDQRLGDSGFRTDTIQLLTINPAARTVKLTSFPRDLYVYIPGYTMQRINTAWGWGGFDALADTMEYNFGVRPDYFVLINFWSFEEVINSLGGIRVDIGRDFCDHRDAYGYYCVSESNYWMNGETALWYVRSRHTSSDVDRGRRQQEVIKGIFDQLISLNGLQRAPELYSIYQNNVDTDLSFDVLAGFIPLAAHLADNPEVGNYSIGYGQVYDWINYSGAMVLVPMREQVLDIMRQVISEP